MLTAPQPRLQVVEVADQGEREQLLLAGEVPVDDRPVDPDRAGDVLDLGVAHAARVEQRPRGVEDLPFSCAGGAAAAAPRRPSEPVVMLAG